jgi:hypothetical protein
MTDWVQYLKTPSTLSVFGKLKKYNDLGRYSCFFLLSMLVDTVDHPNSTLQKGEQTKIKKRKFIVIPHS